MAQAVGQPALTGPLLLVFSVVETDFTMDKMPKRLTKLKSKDR
jgi:hypothetical protein